MRSLSAFPGPGGTVGAPTPTEGPTASILERIFEHNRGANLKIIDTCARLDGERLDAVVPGTYGSARQTLLHLLQAEERYAMRLGAPDWPDHIEDGFPDFDRLRACAERSGTALIEIARTLEPGSTDERTFEGATYEIDRELVLVQAINHATEHRQQVDTSLTAAGIPETDVSGWAWGREAGLMRLRA
jgi:uncharacterized damage-inducible protein DinB